MATAILPRPTTADLAATIERAREYADAAQAPNTVRGYRSAFSAFQAWCSVRAASPLPATPQTVALHLSDVAGTLKIGTLRHRLAAIADAHRSIGAESPTTHPVVRRVVAGIARTYGSAKARKSAITLDELRRMLLCIRGDGLKATRDRALLLLGFAGALRRSEIAALDVADLTWSRVGLTLTIRRSKTDQAGEGASIPVPFLADRALCAARAVREWLDVAGIVDGALFRTFSLGRTATEHRIDGRDVARLVKKLACKAQLVGDFSGHSLRAGFVTSAAQAHVGLDRIAAVTRHRSLEVLVTYIRRSNLFDDAALTSITAPQAQGATP